MGGIYGCGCKEVYRFPHITYAYILLLYLLFFAASLLFKRFFVLVTVLFCNLCNIISRSINTHTGDYRHPMEAI